MIQLPAVGVIIPTYGHFDYAQLAIESACKYTPSATIIVVDDQSPDWPGERIVSGFTDGRHPYYIQRYETNGGLSRSWNAGLRYCRRAGIEYAVCGNSDLVFSDGWWGELVAGLRPRHHSDGPRGRYNFVGPVTNAAGHSKAQQVTRYIPDYEVDDDQDAIDATARKLRTGYHDYVGRSLLNGFCFAGRTEDFWKAAITPTEVFRNDIPLAGNEDEFFERAKTHGMIGGICPRSFVFHYRSVSRGLKGRENLEMGAMRLPEGCTGCGK